MPSLVAYKLAVVVLLIATAASSGVATYLQRGRVSLSADFTGQVANIKSQIDALTNRVATLEVRPYITVTSIHSSGNETCSGNPTFFVFNVTATVANKGGGPASAQILFQLDLVTMHDEVYYFGAGSQTTVLAYKTLNYCEKTGPQQIDVVILSEWRV